MDLQVKLVFDLPTKDSPGYLKRAREAMVFERSMRGEPSPEAMDNMVAFLTQFVAEPTDPAEKTEALWMASENQFIELLQAIRGGRADGENPT